MNKWEHPLGSVGSIPEHVIMLCLGESKRYYADGLASHHEPLFEGAEIWTLNAGFRIWDHDLLFVMDDLEEESHKWPEYGRDLEEYAKDRPIITSQGYPKWNCSFSYPFDEVCLKLKLQGLDRYFFNSVPYMLAYAIFIGVKKITLFGADYDDPSKFEAGRANTEFWLGFARGAGIDVSIIQGSRLMGAHDLTRPLYGYRHDPRIRQKARIEQLIESLVREDNALGIKNGETKTRTRRFSHLDGLPAITESEDEDKLRDDKDYPHRELRGAG